MLTRYERVVRRRAIRLAEASMAVLAAATLLVAVTMSAFGASLPPLYGEPFVLGVSIVATAVAVGLVYWTAATWRLEDDGDQRKSRARNTSKVQRRQSRNRGVERSAAASG